MLAEVTRLDPQFTTPVPVTTLAAFLQDVQDLRTRANELDTALRTRERQAGAGHASRNSSRIRKPPPCGTRTVSSARKSKPSRPNSPARKKPCAAPPRNS